MARRKTQCLHQDELLHADWLEDELLIGFQMGEPKLRLAHLVAGEGSEQKTAKESTHKVQISVYSVNVSWWGGRSVTRGLCNRMEGATGGKGGVNVDGDLGEWEGLLTLPSLADVFRCNSDKLVAVPDGLVLLRKRELALQGGSEVDRK